MSAESNRIVLARYGKGNNAPTLWELPGQGVYLTHPDNAKHSGIGSVAITKV
jgi:hypothetical protein